MGWVPQANREALQKRELERQADVRAKQQELANALQVSTGPPVSHHVGIVRLGRCMNRIENMTQSGARCIA